MSKDFSKSSSDPILPGATIGVLGGGQLGRMFALAARAMGYRIHIFSPEFDAPAAQVADKEIVADYLDLDRIRTFARETTVVTFEFENVPAAATRAAAEETLVRPDGQVLHVTQQRLREKSFLRDHGFPVTPFRAIQSLEELRLAARELGFPAVLKTAGFGYDGKGQVKLQAESDLEPAWKKINGVEAIYEAFVQFTKELSVIGARREDGDFKAFPVFENEHSHHILDVTISPARIEPALARRAQELARGILESLEVVGLLTVELFLTESGELVVNELAPRPHNSGHLTIDACVTSQFEQQLRAICNLPLGSTELRRPAAMANLLGDLWQNGTPNWRAALENRDVKLHLYGKTDARPGRKMGHLTVGADSADHAAQLAPRSAVPFDFMKPGGSEELLVALLRGINVGGKNSLPMRDLVALVEKLGGHSPRTYIQSGNLVFRADKQLAPKFGETLASAIQRTFKLHVPVVIRTATEWNRIVAGVQFPRSDIEQRFVHVMFLAEKPTSERVTALSPQRSPADTFIVSGRDIYLRLPNGVAKSKLTNDYFDRTLRTISTIRNWNTVLKLQEMLEIDA